MHAMQLHFNARTIYSIYTACLPYAHASRIKHAPIQLGERNRPHRKHVTRADQRPAKRTALVTRRALYIETRKSKTGISLRSARRFHLRSSSSCLWPTLSLLQHGIVRHLRAFSSFLPREHTCGSKRFVLFAIDRNVAIGPRTMTGE